MRTILKLTAYAPGLVLALALALPAHAQCDRWQPGFASSGTDGDVNRVLGFRDASGPSLFVTGPFTAVDGVVTGSAARWNGTNWSALPLAPNESVTSFAAYDDGGGEAAYATLQIGSTVRVARWTGATWTNIASNVTSAALVGSLDDGSGPALYLAGAFASVNGVPAPKLARWNGSAWQGFGAGPTAAHHAFVFDDGSGPALYAMRRTLAGPASTTSFERWNGAAWSAALTPLAGLALDVAVYDDGTGPALYACGSVGPGVDSAVARYVGGAWVTLVPSYSKAAALRVHDFGAGPVLCAGISMGTTYGDITTLQCWNGSSWTQLGGDFGPPYSPPSIRSLTSIDLGAGPELVAAGRFDSAGDAGAFDLARWTGSGWSSFGSQGGVGPTIRAFAVHDDGSGPALYAGGSFMAAGNVGAPGVARWSATTSSWSAVGAASSTPPQVRALATFDDGGGALLYAAGYGAVERWDGSTWTTVSGATPVVIEALAVGDIGSGPRLFAAGQFTSIGGVAASNVAAFDGTGWSALGPGVGVASAIAVHDDGSGPKLFVANVVNPYIRVSRWDGAAWSNVGPDFGGWIFVLTSLDDGQGEALYAGGQFEHPPAWHIARWRNGTWSALGDGLGPSLGHYVNAIVVHDDGNGPAVYAGGNFTGVSGSPTPVRRVAKWNGASWSEFGGGIEPDANGVGEDVRALATFVDAATGAPALFAGGHFARAGGLPSNGVAEWVACFPVPVPYCFGDGTGTPCPCGNNGLSGRGCRNVLGQGARLSCTGASRLGADTAVLSVTGMTNQTLLFLQGTERENGGLGTTVFDGLSCLSASIVRLSTKVAVAGASTYPVSGDTPISVRGHVSPSGGPRHYQVFYRDPSSVFCPPGVANWSNGITLQWVP